MPTYLVKLTPLEKFFFGQKHKFNEDDSVNYYLRSARFPQQTALLGLLRYQYLQHAGSEIYSCNRVNEGKWREADALVGPFSFNPEADNEFGQIQSLSPVFLMDTQEEEKPIHYFPIGKRYQEVKGEYKPLELDEQGECLRDYSPKKELPQMWASAEGTPISEDDFFGVDCRVGVRAEKWKKDKEKPDEYGFFYQEFGRFKNERCTAQTDSDGCEVEPEKCVQKPCRSLCFAFYYTSSEKSNLPPSEVVFLGGERQPFLMKVEEIKEADNAEDAYKEGYDEVLRNLPKSPHHSIVLLLSDAKISDNWDNVPFAITEIRDFARVIIPKTEDNIKVSVKKSESDRGHLLAQPPLELYARGSLFYFEDDDKAKAFEAQVLKVNNFHKIGYNYTCLIPKKTN
ncbi:MAG: type III-B CRISPR module-associated Cmr3 family protein [Porphyromonadaceae bacterium]|nr:type III-B CRISPR module-associated Cmr3 family protein [Porphyromonadaceae bacterium]